MYGSLNDTPSEKNRKVLRKKHKPRKNQKSSREKKKLGKSEPSTAMENCHRTWAAMSWLSRVWKPLYENNPQRTRRMKMLVIFHTTLQSIIANVVLNSILDWMKSRKSKKSNVITLENFTKFELVSLWHMNSHFQWRAMVYNLSVLRIITAYSHCTLHWKLRFDTAPWLVDERQLRLYEACLLHVQATPRSCHVL